MHYVLRQLSFVNVEMEMKFHDSIRKITTWEDLRKSPKIVQDFVRISSLRAFFFFPSLSEMNNDDEIEPFHTLVDFLSEMGWEWVPQERDGEDDGVVNEILSWTSRPGQRHIVGLDDV